MKQVFLLIAFFVFCLDMQAQEPTIEYLGIVSRVNNTECNDTVITPIFFEVVKTTTENGTDYPNIEIDTILFQSGACPADSIEVLRQLTKRAKENQNKAARAMSQAFEKVRRGEKMFQDIRDHYNAFTGSELYYRFEDDYFDALSGTYNLIDIQDGPSSIKVDLIRIGANQRWRFEVADGEPGAGTRYTVFPRSNQSFEIRNWAPNGGSSANFLLFMDTGVEASKPVFRENGFLEGGDEDILRAKKIR